MKAGLFTLTPQLQTAANLISLPSLALSLYLAVEVVSAWWLLLSFAVYCAFNIAVAVGYHQLFTHQSFKTTRFWEVAFAFVGTLAFQGSPVAWAHLHFVHHRTSDTEQDPHVRSLWFFLVKWYRKVNMPPAKIVRKMLGDPMQRFLHNYGLLICVGLAAVLWATDPLLLLFGYLAPVGYFFLAIACSQILSHAGGKPRNTYWLILFFPLGEWLHRTHHETPNDWRKGGWCLSYGLIPWIST